MNRLFKGTLAGLAATIPMTLAMEAMYRYLPPREQYPLPPRLITDEVADGTGVSEHLEEGDHKWLTLAAHFGYGAAAGGLYSPLADRTGLSSLTGGIIYGLTVWAGSYLGLLPAAGILRPATEHPPHRTSLMIAAHVVWGAALGALAGRGRKVPRK